jgi:ABC-type transport system involved in multi-copper enzyme maturation permease subunit
MKYLAILKDSLREALDSTVLYVMLGLSALVILFVGTMSFTPLPAAKTMEKLVDGTIGLLLDAQKPEKMTPERMRNMHFPDKSMQLMKTEVIKGEPDSPMSEYRLTLSVQFPDDAKAAAAREQPGAGVKRIQELFASAVDVGLIQIGDISLAAEQPKGADASRVEFVVTTRPTAETRRLWLTSPSLFFGAVPLGSIEMPLGIQLFYLTSLVIFIGSWCSILGGVIISSFFIPNMLRKGTIDLLLVKPMHRWLLLSYKYVGGLTFIFINNAFAITGIWLALGLRSGIWANWFLLLIFVLTFFFAILYAVSTLMAVLTGSGVTAILVTIGAWFIFFVVGSLNQVFDNQRRIEEAKQVPAAAERHEGPGLFAQVVGVVHAVLPRTADLDRLGNLLIVSDFVTGSWSEARKLDTGSSSWSTSLLVSGLFIVILLGASCWWFSTKDY